MGESTVPEEIEKSKNKLKWIPIPIGFLVLVGIIWSLKAFYFNPSRLQETTISSTLGQLGDYVGGILNPIFGFLTVCLLIWSISIQRKELSLTSDELKKSANALNMQVKLATNEYNRKQIDESLGKLYNILDSLFTQHITTPLMYEVNNNLNQPIASNFTSLKDVSVMSTTHRNCAALVVETSREQIDTYQNINLFDTKTLPQLLATIGMILENISSLTQEIMKLTNIVSIKNSRYIEIEKEVERFRQIKAISNETANNLLVPIRNLMNSTEVSSGNLS